MKHITIYSILLLLLANLSFASNRVVFTSVDNMSGRVQNTSAVSYATARDVNECGLAQSTSGIVGQRYTASTYCVYRTLYRFDTSFLGASVTVDSVKFHTVVDAASSTPDNVFYMMLCAVQDTVSTGYFGVFSFNKFEGWAASGYYSPTIMSDSVSCGVSPGDTISFSFDATGIAEINQTGTTQFYLLSGNDIGNINPKRGAIPIYYEDFLLEDDSPYMEVWYSSTPPVGGGACSAYYVSYEFGDDNRDSTTAKDPATPWKHHPDSNLATSNSVLHRTKFADGDSIIMRLGETWNNTTLTTQMSGVSAGIITTTKANFGSGANPIISGAINYADSTWIDNGDGEWKIWCSPVTTNVYYGDIRLTSGTPGSLGDNGFGTVDGTGTADTLYVKIGQDPNGEDIRVAWRRALYSGGHNYRRYKNLDFRYSNDATGGVIYLNTCIYNEISYCTISRGASYGIRYYTCTNSSLHHSTITDSPNIGVFISYASHTDSIYNCNIHNIWNNALYGAGGAGKGVALNSGATSGANNLVYNCTIDSCYTGIVVDQTGTVGNTISYNLVRWTLVNPIAIMAQGASPTATNIYHNLILHLPILGAGGTHNGHGLSCQTDAKNAVIKNNMIIGLDLAEAPKSADLIKLQFNGAYTLDIDNNLYFGQTGTTWAYEIPTGGTFTTFTDWQDSLAIDGSVTGADANGMNADPIMYDLTNGYYRLKELSPAIDTGVDVGLTTDFGGNAIIGLPEIGIYETDYHKRVKLFGGQRLVR